MGYRSGNSIRQAVSSAVRSGTGTKQREQMRKQRSVEKEKAVSKHTAERIAGQMQVATHKANLSMRNAVAKEQAKAQTVRARGSEQRKTAKVKEMIKENKKKGSSVSGKKVPKHRLKKGDRW